MAVLRIYLPDAPVECALVRLDCNKNLNMLTAVGKAPQYQILWNSPISLFMQISPGCRRQIWRSYCCSCVAVCCALLRSFSSEYNVLLSYWQRFVMFDSANGKEVTGTGENYIIRYVPILTPTLQYVPIVRVTLRYVPIVTLILHYVPIVTLILHYVPIVTLILQYVPIVTLMLQYVPIVTLMLQYVPIVTVTLRYVPIVTITQCFPTFSTSRYPWPRSSYLTVPLTSLFISHGTLDLALHISRYPWPRSSYLTVA
jgi:hypothetical protein